MHPSSFCPYTPPCRITKWSVQRSNISTKKTTRQPVRKHSCQRSTWARWQIAQGCTLYVRLLSKETGNQ
eukprot:12431348-Karenia_brevis.AAC.1